MPEIRLLVRGKKGMEVQSFKDFGDGTVRDDKENTYQMVVNRPSGGVLVGNTRISFNFPKD